MSECLGQVEIALPNIGLNFSQVPEDHFKTSGWFTA